MVTLSDDDQARRDVFLARMEEAMSILRALAAVDSDLASRRLPLPQVGDPLGMAVSAEVASRCVSLMTGPRFSHLRAAAGRYDFSDLFAASTRLPLSKSDVVPLAASEQVLSDRALPRIVAQAGSDPEILSFLLHQMQGPSLRWVSVVLFDPAASPLARTGAFLASVSHLGFESFSRVLQELATVPGPALEVFETLVSDWSRNPSAGDESYLARPFLNLVDLARHAVSVV